MADSCTSNFIYNNNSNNSNKTSLKSIIQQSISKLNLVRRIAAALEEKDLVKMMYKLDLILV